MSIKMTVSHVDVIGTGVWVFNMHPHQVRLFGNPGNSVGTRSVLILKDYDFDKKAKELSFEVDDATSINIGTLPITIGLAEPIKQKTNKADVLSEIIIINANIGRGDREFLNMSKLILSEDMQSTAKLLLMGVRRRSAGELKRGKARNFSETPDNFWYVIVQPQIDQLSITVRGNVEHFESIAKLPIKDDRGNTLFKVTSEADVAAALDLIFHAKRKL